MAGIESWRRDQVSDPALTPDSLTRFSAAHAGRIWVLLLLALALAATALFLAGPWPALLPLAGAGTLLVVALVMGAGAVRSRAAARDAAASVRAVIEHDAAPCVATDMDGVVQIANAAARERFELRQTETLARLLRDLFANPSAVIARLQTRAAARGAAREDILTRRGHVRLSVHGFGEGGLLWRIEDMPERAASGRGAESLSLPMMTVGKSGTVLFMNDALRRLLGGRVRTLDRVFTRLPLRSNAIHTVHGADGPVQARVIELEGTAGRREIFLIPAGEMAAAVEAQGQGAFDHLPVALLKIGREGEVLSANRLARALLGAGAKPGARVAGLLEGLGRPVGDWLEEALAGRGLGRPETLRAAEAERETFVQVTLERMSEGEETVLVAVLSDATELKSLEAQFVQSQKMQAIGQLAGGVAHDFNNLLTAISGHCDLLLLRHGSDDPDYADLVQINQNANRAASLVGQLLAFSRKQTLRMAPVDLRDCLGELTHLLNRLLGEKVFLTLVHDPELKPIRADKRQLEQVIMNLVVNARDAMPDGGDVRIETELRRFEAPFERDRVSVPAGEYVLVRVTDAGHGIPPESLPKIFEPFFSTKRVGDGTGLGLSTAYGIVKQSGGYIFADSVLGAGTTFTLFFPIHEAGPEDAAPAPAPAAPQHPEHDEGVVLLVEDEAPVRAFASRALRLRGYTVIEAENAEEALRALEDTELKVDVFVTDVIMPGMDGPSWVRKALEARPDARVVFVSGYAEESFADAQARIPNSVFLPKPFSLNDLAATVHDQIH